MEIFKDFGVNPILLVAQIINFLIVLFLLNRFIYKPVLDILKKREQEIKKGLENSTEAERLLQEAKEKESKILQKAQIHAEKIVNDAKIEAEQTRTQIEETVKRESERMINKAREKIEQETMEAEERLGKKIGLIAVTLLEKSLKGIFGKTEQKAILKKAQIELEKHNAV